MENILQSQRLAWKTDILGCMVLLCLWTSAIVWAETADSPSGRGQGEDQQKETTIRLEDGTLIELTATQVLRKQKDDSEPERETVLWSIPVKEPRLSLVFENRNGLQLLLYYTVTGEHSGEFRAVRVKDGKEHWGHPIWFPSASDPITSPIFAEPWIYFGRMTWLEKMDPDDGKIIERYPARAIMTSLQRLPDGTLEIQAEDKGALADTFTLRFQNGQFFPHIAACREWELPLQLLNRSGWVMEGFDGTLDPNTYSGYLDLHRIKTELLPPEFVLQWRDFDLQKTEQVYRKAYQRDLANPYFALYLALSIYYQNRQAEAEPYFQDALRRSEQFWEESLQLGGNCESLGLTQWADMFYEQGIRWYFQDVQAPPHHIFFIEILKVFQGGNRQSQASFSQGNIDRALHLFEVRRQLFPYTEGDNWFLQKYIPWLEQTGREDQATLEEKRFGKFTFFLDPAGLTPGSLTGFLVIGFLVLGAIILKNEAHSWSDIVVVLIAMSVIPGIVIIPGVGRTLKAALLIVTVVGYAGAIVFLRRRRSQTPVSQWQSMLYVLISSYIVLLTGVLAAYIGGEEIFHSPIGGKVAEILFLLAFTGLFYHCRRGADNVPSFKHFKLFIFVWVVLWCQLAWFHYDTSPIREKFLLPAPSIDLGHPNWSAFADKKVEQAEFRNRDLLFMQAVVHQLGGDFEFARQIYQQYPNDARASNNLGVMLLNDEPQEAGFHFERAIEIDPEFAPALYNLGVITGDQRKIEQSKAGDPWRVNAYQTYAPGKPWIVVPPIVPDWKNAAYWSHGGFLLQGFAEILFKVTWTFYYLFYVL